MKMFTVLMCCLLIIVHSVADFPFQNPKLSWTTRVDDLVSRLTLDEMTQQIAMGGRNTHAPGIPRLSIPPYPWGSECLRGDVDAGPATSFPQAIGLAATFSQQVIFDVARATALEVRAKFNNYTAHHDYGQHTSASCWSPVINIMRDPRWGRNQETYGEDPYMSGKLSQAFVFGLQGQNPRYILANAGCKHFDVYAGPEDIPESRHSFNAKLTEHDWRMTFLPAFKACVAAGSFSLMCSYNRVNGVPACANKYLLTDILRGEWGFNGYVISDEGAIEDIMLSHKYTSTKADTAAVSLNAGTNLEDGPGGMDPFLLAIPDAVKQGKLSMETVRNATWPLFYTRMRLGLFDPPSWNPYSSLRPQDVVQSEAHRNLSISTALRSFVLLKNTDNFLPLPQKTWGKVAIVGPLSDNTPAIFGGYAPNPDPKYVVSPFAGLKGLGAVVTHEAGCVNNDVACKKYNSTAIHSAVQGADLVIVALGTGCEIECEGNDRSDILLPGKQLQLLQDAVSAGGNASVILLLFNAGPLDISWALSASQVKAIVAGFFPAQAAGTALWRMIHNTEPAANPGGRLPATWPRSIDQISGMTNYSMAGRTYRYSQPSPMFPFGFGLSYSRFSYSSLDVRPQILHFTDDLIIEAYVQNEGPYDGEEVVQAYVTWPTDTTLHPPDLQLVGFERYPLKNARGILASFRVSPEQLSVWDDNRRSFAVPRGVYTVYVGGQQPNQSVKVPSNVLRGQFTVV